MKKKTVEKWSNGDHPLGNILSRRKPDLRGAPTEVGKVDLRFLTGVSLSDTYDGRSSPADGLDMTIVMYGDRVVCTKSGNYWNGSCEQRLNSGNQMFLALIPVARAYLKIQNIAVVKYHGGNVFLSMLKKKGWDHLIVSAEHLKTLQDHPQYIGLADLMGVILRPVKGENGGYKVVVTKTHQLDP